MRFDRFHNVDWLREEGKGNSKPPEGDGMKTKDDLLIEMGNRLRQQRKQMKLTQEELAERSGLSVKTILSAEKGRKALHPENIVLLCQLLDMDISYLMTGQVSPSKTPFVKGDFTQKIKSKKII